MKQVWVIGEKREEMIQMQQLINQNGSLRAVCMLSFEHVKKQLVLLAERKNPHTLHPSLIILDFDKEQEWKSLCVEEIHKQPSLAGVPLLFFVEKSEKQLEKSCYELGAMIVIEKPVSELELMRIERAAWQYDMTRSYEKMLQKQASDLKNAKEIKRLNEQLETRNDLLHQVFGRYFSEGLVEKILENPNGATIGGEKVEATILMSDLRDFTALSENLEPETVTNMLNIYYDEMAKVISKYKGTVIEFLGDGILAVFGAPLYNEKHNENAVLAAIEMQKALISVNEQCRFYEYPELSMGIGIHTGEVFVGNVGSERMMRYNVIGSTVNIASRIQGISESGEVLISSTAAKNLNEKVMLDDGREVSLKGVEKPMTVYRVIFG